MNKQTQIDAIPPLLADLPAACAAAEAAVRSLLDAARDRLGARMGGWIDACADAPPILQASPRSMIDTPPSPRRTRMFDGLMSRCAYLASCSVASASADRAMISTMSSRDRARSNSTRSTPSISSVAIHGCPSAMPESTTRGRQASRRLASASSSDQYWRGKPRAE